MTTMMERMMKTQRPTPEKTIQGSLAICESVQMGHEGVYTRMNSGVSSCTSNEHCLEAPWTPAIGQITSPYLRITP